jgi:hypothetical protein
MPLLSPSPPCPISFSPDFSQFPPLSEIVNDFPKALYPVLEAIKPTLEPLGYALPALALTLLFLMSTRFTEAITEGKYEAYKAYQERVGKFGFVHTWEKGLWLAWKGRKEEVDAALWGSGKLGDKEE